MTRELERVLRATFEDRTQPVPPQTDGLADAVIGRARGVRRRRALAGSASALAVVVLAGLALVFGKAPFAGEELPSGDNLPIPVIQGLDVAVPNPSDKSGPYLQAGDGTRVPLPKDETLVDAVRVDGGFFAVTMKAETSTLSFYPTSGAAAEVANGKKLAMAVDATGRRLAVTRVEGAGVRLDIYNFDRDLLKTEQLTPGSVLNGWSGGLLMLSEADILTAWDPADGSHYPSPPEKSMRFMGPTTDGSTYVTLLDPKEGTCLTWVRPVEHFATEKRYCYTEVPAEAVTISPNAEWFVARGFVAPEDYRFVRTHFSQDLISPGDGSMQPMGAADVNSWMWLSDQELVYRAGEEWFKTNLFSGTTEPLPIPGGSSAYPVPRAFIG